MPRRTLAAALLNILAVGVLGCGQAPLPGPVAPVMTQAKAVAANPLVVAQLTRKLRVSMGSNYGAFDSEPTKVTVGKTLNADEVAFTATLKVRGMFIGHDFYNDFKMGTVNGVFNSRTLKVTLKDLGGLPANSAWYINAMGGRV